MDINPHTAPPSIRPSLGPSTQRRRLYVTLINNTVDAVYFSELCTVYFTHGRHGAVELQIRDGDGSWPKTPHESSSFFVRCRTPCFAMHAVHGLKYPSTFIRNSTSQISFRIPQVTQTRPDETIPESAAAGGPRISTGSPPLTSYKPWTPI